MFDQVNRSILSLSVPAPFLRQWFPLGLFLPRRFPFGLFLPRGFDPGLLLPRGFGAGLLLPPGWFFLHRTLRS